MLQQSQQLFRCKLKTPSIFRELTPLSKKKHTDWVVLVITYNVSSTHLYAWSYRKLIALMRVHPFFECVLDTPFFNEGFFFNFNLCGLRSITCRYSHLFPLEIFGSYLDRVILTACIFPKDISKGSYLPLYSAKLEQNQNSISVRNSILAKKVNNQLIFANKFIHSWQNVNK